MHGSAGWSRRGSLTVWFTEVAIAAWRAEPRTTRGGQPHYSALAITTGLTLRAVFRLALRQIEGLIGSIIYLLGLDLAIPDHSTLSRRAETLEKVRAPANAEPVHLLVDSAGIKNPRSKLRGIGGRKEADQKNAASCGEYVPKEIEAVRCRRVAGREAWHELAKVVA